MCLPGANNEAGKPDLVTVRYLTEKQDFKPPSKTDRNYNLSNVRPADRFYHSYHCIEDSDITDIASLPNKIEVQLLNVEVFMVNPVRYRGGKLHTRMQERSIPTAKMWAERFSERIINREDDEVPFMLQQLRAASTASSLPAIDNACRDQLLLA